MSHLPSTSIDEVIAELKAAANSEECLRRAFDILSEKYHGSRLLTYLRLWELRPTPPEYLWARSGFLHCTHINALLRLLLLGSRKFRDDDIRTRWTLIILSPHQYSQVRIGDRWINVDVWAHRFGIPLGEHAHWFHF